METQSKGNVVYAVDHVPVLAHRPKPKQPLKPGQIWLIFRRILVLAAAFTYIITSLRGAIRAFEILHGIVDNTVKFDPYQADYITSFAQPDKFPDEDATTVGQSKFVIDVLNGIITPRVNETYYLHSRQNASFDSCPYWPNEATQHMYNDLFLRKIFRDAVVGNLYAIPQLVGTEMVVPIVDCSFTGLQKGDKSNMRAFYFMKKINSTNVNDTFLITFSLSMQHYRFPDQHQLGPTGVLVLSFVSDFTDNYVTHYYSLTPGYPYRSTTFSVYTRLGMTDDGYMILQNIPTAATAADPTKVFEVSMRSGIFRKTESEQGQIKNLYWEPSLILAFALSQWEWHGTSLRCDSWAWVHGIHFVFVADTCFNLLVLLIVIYRNKLKGKVWVGDAFVSISKTTLLRASMVVIAWALNGFWTPHKFMLEEGNVLGNVTTLFIYPHLMHADLMMIYLGIVDLVGFVMCERIDPALAILLFELGFSYRRSLAMWFPLFVNSIVEFARRDYALGLESVSSKMVAISPLRVSTTHLLSDFNSTIAFTAIFPIFSTLIFLIAYVPARKVFRYYFPDRYVRLSRGSSPSVETDSILSWKSSLTMFEVATGAALQTRVGLVSDYDNCIYIKSMKFASADGIYCNGFVVVNNKYLVQTGDLWMMTLMILTRVRFRQVYVFEIEGYTVQKTARLFYPEMMTWSDLFHLHTMILA